jgi:hypothetical protein
MKTLIEQMQKGSTQAGGSRKAKRTRRKNKKHM